MGEVGERSHELGTGRTGGRGRERVPMSWGSGGGVGEAGGGVP